MSTPTQIDLETLGCSEYTIAGQLLALFVTQLATTRAGAPDVAVVHPGDITPDYGCGLATVRVTQVGLVPGSQRQTSAPCVVDQHAVTLELRMVRCYETPDDNGMPDPVILDSAARDAFDDARAMRVAAEQLRSLNRSLRVVFGQWRPQGPKGGVHGGALTVQVFTELGNVGPDELAPPLPGDPHGV